MKPTRPVYSRDPKAPRMKKGRFSKQVITKELYKRFINDFPEYKDMTWNDFFGLWKDIAETMRHEIVFNPLGVKLGAYCGELKYQYLPHKFKAADNSTSVELGQKIDHLNIVTRGKVATLKWERRWAVKFNKMLQFFAFEPNQDIKYTSKIHAETNPEKIRMSRNTLGGFSIWRSGKNKK